MQREFNLAYVLSITLVATLGGLLFGYDTAVISGAERAIQTYLIHPLGLNAFIHGITVSSALIGCIMGSSLSGLVSSSLGRKKTLLITSVLFFLSALGSAYPETLFFVRGEPSAALLITFNAYRILGGIGVGLASAVCPMYISEVAPARIRGRLVSLNQLAIVIGMLTVYFVNWSIARGQSVEWINETGWRYMFASEAIPAAMFGVLLLFVPETPRFLMMKNQDDRAFRVLAKINGAENARIILGEITGSLQTSSARLFSFGKRVIIIGVLLSLFQQFVGVNVALYYAPRIFESMGATKDASFLQTIIVGSVNVVFTLVAIMTVDRVGRKPLLVIGSIGMSIGMFSIAGLAFANTIGIGTLIFIIIFMASFTMSWGPVCWVLISEIFPNRIRSKATAVAVAAQWMANFLISSTYPPMMELSGGMTYGFYGAMALLSALFVWKMVPETRNKPLEEMEKLWKPGTSVQ